MSLTVVLPDAPLEGGGKTAGAVAASLLDGRDDARVLCLGDGPLTQWVRERVGPSRLELVPYGAQWKRTAIHARLVHAEKALATAPCSTVYVYSLQAPEFATAAKATGKIAVLHVAESIGQVHQLLSQEPAIGASLFRSDAIVLGADDLQRAPPDVEAVLPQHRHVFGTAVDVKAVVQLAQEAPGSAQNATGQQLAWDAAPTVIASTGSMGGAGWGVFRDTAAALPDRTFLWLERPSARTATDSPADAPPNLYLAHPTANALSAIARCCVFFCPAESGLDAASMAEILVLGVPLVAFGEDLANRDFLGRNAILCHGKPNVSDLERVIRLLDAGELADPQWRELTKAYRNRFDLRPKLGALNRFLDSL